IDRVQGAGSQSAVITLRYINPNNNAHWTDTFPSRPDPQDSVGIVKTYPAMDPAFEPTWYFTDGPSGTGSVPYIHWTAAGVPVNSTVVSDFSPFGFGFYNNTVLPIRLLTFAGEGRQGNGYLRWTVADNAEVKYFVVEHSTDGRNFKAVGQLNKGTTDAYDFTHVSLVPGNNYYRLRMVDKDGKVEYSRVVMIPYGRIVTTIVGLRPTLVRDHTQLTVVSARGQAVQIRMMDMRGRVIRTEKAQLQPGNNIVPVYMRGLAAAMYQLHVLTEDGVQANFKVMKE
ncbi:MAG TPA: hypothetical protein VK907_10200, partial [Phnomibacter sp.]|nr:hypothetical protein [Phnomibacter sp.]